MEEKSCECKSEIAIKVAILDWDNTLIPTTQIFGNKNKIKNESNDQVINAGSLENLGKMVYKLLLKYIKLYGRQNIFIITNATGKWIHLSLHLLQLQKMNSDKQITVNSDKQITASESHLSYFKAIEHLLITQSITIISAKDLYENEFPKQTTLWKSKVFGQIITAYCRKDKINNIKYSILSIGDSNDEFVASYNGVELLKQTYKIDPKNVILHRIKLKPTPTINEMIDQIGLLLTLSDVLCKEMSNSQTIHYEKELKRHSAHT